MNQRVKNFLYQKSNRMSVYRYSPASEKARHIYVKCFKPKLKLLSKTHFQFKIKMSFASFGF